MPRVDILDEPERLRGAFIGSVGLHGAVFALAVLYAVTGGGRRETWGDLNSGGPGSVAVNVVKSVPLPSRAGVINPVANDTQSVVPAPPPLPREQQKVKPPELGAIPLKSPKAPKRPSREESSRSRYRPVEKYPPNQLYSSTGQALVSPMIAQTGSGGIGVGTGSPFGDRFGYYVDLIRQQVARNWSTADVDARLKTAPAVVVTFTILRDGSVRDVRIAQRSGNAVL